MLSNKTNIIIEETFKSDDKNLRLITLQNIFIKLIRACELVEDTSLIDTNFSTKENPHE